MCRNELHAAVGGNSQARREAIRDLVDTGVVIRQRGQRLVRFTLARDYNSPASSPLPAAPKVCEASDCTARARHRFCSDTCRRRQAKAERVTDNDKYFAWVENLIRKAADRASEDINALPLLAAAADQALAALALAVEGCRAQGHSDAEIGQALGITRQAVQKRFRRQPEVVTHLSKGHDR